MYGDAGNDSSFFFLTWDTHTKNDHVTLSRLTLLIKQQFVYPPSLIPGITKEYEPLEIGFFSVSLVDFPVYVSMKKLFHGLIGVCEGLKLHRLVRK